MGCPNLPLKLFLLSFTLEVSVLHGPDEEIIDVNAVFLFISIGFGSSPSPHPSPMKKETKVQSGFIVTLSNTDMI